MSPVRRSPLALALLLSSACTPHGPDASAPRRESTHVEPPPPPAPVLIEAPLIEIEPVAAVGPVPAALEARCFASAVDHVLPFAPFAGELADIDGDRDLDVVVIGWPGEGVITMANDLHARACERTD